MAIPTSLFRLRYGVAVMRWDQAANEWHFVCWSNRSGVVLDLPPGGHIFALWLIIGDLAGFPFVEYDGVSALYALRARR